MTICIPCDILPSSGFCATILAIAKLCFVITKTYNCKLSDIYLDSSNYKNPYIIGGNIISPENIFLKYFSCFSTNKKSKKLSKEFYTNTLISKNIDINQYGYIAKQMLDSLQLNIKNKIDNFITKNINLQNTLGIKFRETDYRFKPFDHAKQLDRKSFISIVIQFLEKNKNILQVFVATESNEFINELKNNKFIIDNNIKIISTNNKLFINGKHHHALLKTQNIDNCFDLNIDYLIDIFVISKLKYLILNVTTSNCIIDMIRNIVPVYQHIVNIGYYKKEQLILADNIKYVKEKHIYTTN